MKTFITWLIGIFSSAQVKSPKYPGVVSDPRSTSQKNTDAMHEEVSFGAQAPLYGTGPIATAPFPLDNQYQDSCCGGEAGRVVGMAEQKRKGNPVVSLSAAFIYWHRLNKPGAGMFLQDFLNILCTLGTCLYPTFPTPTSDAAIDATVITPEMINEAAIYKGLTPFIIGPSTRNLIDTYATIGSLGHGVAIEIWADESEWEHLYVDVLLPDLTVDTAQINHFVTVIPNSAFMVDGKKYITVQDSVPWGSPTQIRHLSEKFVQQRIDSAGYINDVVFTQHATVKPVHTFATTLKVGANSMEVMYLQQALQWLGYFPSNFTCTTYFGGLTLAAVNSYQLANVGTILTPNGLTAPTGYAGPSTLAQLNKDLSV